MLFFCLFCKHAYLYMYKKGENMQYERSEQVNELFAALSKAQGDMKPAIKDSKNPHFRSTYADLNSCWETVRPILNKYDLSLVQLPGSEAEKVWVTSILGHSSGQYISSTLVLPIGRKHDAQGVGSAITYARRYSMTGILGLSQEDDDGNAASQQAPQKQPPKPQPAPKPQPDPSAKIDAAGISYIENLAKKHTIIPEDLKEFLGMKFKVEALADLTNEQAKALSAMIIKGG